MSRIGVASKRLLKEIASLKTNPPDNICAGPKDMSDLFHWEATLFGPEDTPYEGGIFKIDMVFSTEYPIRPPECHFTTKIWHPNVSESNGSICVDILNSNWSAALSIESLLVSLSSLLMDPNPSSPLNSTAARQYQENRKKYDETVREYVSKYASGE